ncbi:recombinase family protein [Anaerofustis sp.]|uniref:recombinase family protein n=1 Tax=Anaerofustis sp. TaxID=1872517 RepID=UPI0025C64958|nr:recombinase family protein [Anaerofustis sp.]
MKIYDYVRVSTKDQNVARQFEAMKNFPVEEKNVVVDKFSGKDFNRPNYKKLLRKMKKGDVLVVKSIDRLGRNYDEILEQWRSLTKERHIDIVVIDMPLLDTREGRDLTGTLIADIVLQLLSYVAQSERENIKQRQMEGIWAAQERGGKFGRPRLTIPNEFFDLYDLWQNGSISSRKAAKRLNVSYQTFIRWTERMVCGDLFS